MAIDFTIKQGDTLPVLRAVLRDADNDVIDLTGVVGLTLRYRMRNSTTIVERTATVVDANSGIVEYAWIAADTATAGELLAEWRVDYGAGAILTVPNNEPLVISVVENLVTAEPNEDLFPVDTFITNYLFGIDLTDDDGNPYPRSIFNNYIDAAIQYMETQLDIPIRPVDIVNELHDHFAMDYGRWGYFQLDKYPVISIATGGVRFQYPSQVESVTIDDQWIVLQDEGQSGVVQIVPGQGNIADVLLIPGTLFPLWSGAYGRVPGVWRFNYRAGFTTLPADIAHLISLAAAIPILDIAGDLIAGAGIANFSISVPGLSQSIGTTSSATNSGYGARALSYRRQINEQLPGIKRFYGKGLRMHVV